MTVVYINSCVDFVITKKITNLEKTVHKYHALNIPLKQEVKKIESTNRKCENADCFDQPRQDKVQVSIPRISIREISRYLYQNMIYEDQVNL